MFGLFRSKKPKGEDTSPSGTPVHIAEAPVPPPDQAGNVPYPLLNAAANNTGNDYDQLYTFMDFTVIGSTQQQQQQHPASRGDQLTPNYLIDIPFRTAMVSASDLNTVQDLDLLLLQFSTKLSSVQGLVSADYDFAVENQIMDESQATQQLSKSDSSEGSETVEPTEEEQMAKLLEFASLS